MICTAYELYTHCFLFETRQVSHTQRSGSNHERATAVFLSAKEIALHCTVDWLVVRLCIPA